MKYFHSIWYFFPYKIDKLNDRHRAIYNKKKVDLQQMSKKSRIFNSLWKKNELM